jgi:hypothetical protein
MRPLLLFWLMMACCLEAKPFQWPWNTRAKEQQRINAATEPKPTSREAEILRADETKAFNLSSAKFGTGVSITGKKTGTNEFQFVDRTRTKSFATKDLPTKQASGTGSKFETKAAPTKDSWFSRLTSPTKSYATRESSDSKKNLQGSALPGSEKNFVARGRRQAALDADRAERREPKMAIGGDRDGGESWSGDVKPLTIQDVKALLNKN